MSHANAGNTPVTPPIQHSDLTESETLAVADGGQRGGVRVALGDRGGVRAEIPTSVTTES